MGGPAGRRPLSYTVYGVEATAYSSDWRSCGWEWGLALGPLPLYVPLCLGRRPSGTTALPLVPKPRREKADGKMDLLLGGMVLGVVSAVSVGAMAALDGGKAAAAAAARLAGRSSSVPSASASFFAAHPVVRRMARAGLLGGALGATQFPLGRYWAETNLKGLRYYGTTASGAMPRQGREVIYRTSPLADPVTFVARLLTLQWSPVDYTIAADTEYYPLGTRMHVHGVGWGVVEDRGGKVKGPDRIDVYHSRRKDALQFGRRRVDVTILPV